MPRASKAGAAKTSKVKATMAKAVSAIKGKKKAEAAKPVPTAAKKAAQPPSKAAPAPAKATAPAKKAAKAVKKTAAAPKKQAVPKAAPAKKAAAPAKKAAAPKKAAPAAKAPAAKAAAPKQAAPVKKAANKAVDKAAPAAKSAAPKKEAPATVAATKKAAGKAPVLDKFLLEQQALLHAERREYEQQAAALKAEADSLAQEMEPGDIQFDEESGEGGTMNIDRERDLALAGQARLAVDEIDHALAKIEVGTYGDCERCGQPIPKARLKALPYARLCVACKSGGLSRR